MRLPFSRRKSIFAGQSSILRPAQTSRRKSRHRWKWTLGALALAVAAVLGLGIWKYFQTQGAIQDPRVSLPGAPPGKPFNALLVGSDSREGLTAEEQLRLGASAEGVTGERADTLILAHVDPSTNKVVMVQFPRDLYVPVGGGRRAKINEALEQGPMHLIDVVRRLTRLEINRYVKVNIAGFRDLVDAIGGVEVCIAEPIPFDPQTGLEITSDEVGMVHFDGEEALRFVRSRKVFEGGDFDRIRNQQKFLAAAVNKVTSAGTLLRPDRIFKILDVVGENLSTNVGTSLRGLRQLLERFRGFDPERYEAYTAPNLGPSTVTLSSGTELSVVQPDLPAMKKMFDAISQNQSPTRTDGVPDVDLSTIGVGVYNGTIEDGAAAAAAAELERATTSGSGPVEIVQEANAVRSDFDRTVVRYEPRAERKALAVAAALPGARLQLHSTPPGIDVSVIVGSDFRARRIVQLFPLPLPEAEALPEVCRA